MAVNLGWKYIKPANLILCDIFFFVRLKRNHTHVYTAFRLSGHSDLTEARILERDRENIKYKYIKECRSESKRDPPDRENINT